MPIPDDSASSIAVQVIARNRLMRSGLRLFVENWPGLTVTSEAETVFDACVLQKATSPDVIVLDLDDDSIHSLATLRSAYLTSRVIVLTPQHEEGDARLKSASGMVCRHEAEEFLGPAIEAVHRGECWPRPISRGLVAD